jgi:N12 class adenine-specific DNA methylase
VVNQEATLAAKEKQKQIKERFRTWLFTDPTGPNALVRLYNDTYNNIRLRRYSTDRTSNSPE